MNIPSPLPPRKNKDKDAKSLTKREHFAGLAMQGLLSGNRVSMSNTAAEVVKIADCLLAELEKSDD